MLVFVVVVMVVVVCVCVCVCFFFVSLSKGAEKLTQKINKIEKQHTKYFLYSDILKTVLWKNMNTAWESYKNRKTWLKILMEGRLQKQLDRTQEHLLENLNQYHSQPFGNFSSWIITWSSSQNFCRKWILFFFRRKWA